MSVDTLIINQTLSNDKALVNEQSIASLIYDLLLYKKLSLLRIKIAQK